MSSYRACSGRAACLFQSGLILERHTVEIIGAGVDEWYLVFQLAVFYRLSATDVNHNRNFPSSVY